MVFGTGPGPGSGNGYGSMFTGIVERRATLSRLCTTCGGKRLEVVVDTGGSLPEWEAVEVGESIAVSGVCLTAVEAAGSRMAFDVVPETLDKTGLGGLAAGDAVNIERSMRAGDRFGGHYVTGHIDGTGTVIGRDPEGDQVLFRIGVGERLIREIIRKGSITVDGVSLTVVEVSREGTWFSFAAIPHTLELTTLGRRVVGDVVNLETDAFGKWVLHGLEELGIRRD